MQRIADHFGHEAIGVLSHHLLVYLHELQGDTAAALVETRRSANREQKAPCESLQARARLIEWRLELREKKASVQRLAHRSSTFERMAFHDALIDIDHFKQINDNYSHDIGDAVLKELATILDGEVRESDLAARLAGDEFVLVLNDAEPASRPILLIHGITSGQMRIPCSVDVASRPDRYKQAPRAAQLPR